MNARVVPREAANQYTYALTLASVSVSWMFSATVMPFHVVASSHASVHAVPFGCHSDIQTRLRVGNGVSAGFRYGCPVWTSTQRSAARSASIAAVYAACSSQPAASQHAMFTGRRERCTV